MAAEDTPIKSADRTIELLEQLITHKQNLVNKLVEKGVSASMSDSFDSIVQKAGDYIPEGYTEDSEVMVLIDKIHSVYTSGDYGTSTAEIGNASYRCLGWQRWEDWVNSAFNVDGYYFDDDGYLVSSDGKYVVYGTNNTNQTKTGVISPGSRYELID